MPFEEKYWYTKEGVRISIKEMDINHLENTIALLENNPEFYEEGCYDACGGDSYYDPNYELQEKKLKELKEELEKRVFKWN